MLKALLVNNPVGLLAVDCLKYRGSSSSYFFFFIFLLLLYRSSSSFSFSSLSFFFFIFLLFLYLSPSSSSSSFFFFIFLPPLLLLFVGPAGTPPIALQPSMPFVLLTPVLFPRSSPEALHSVRRERPLLAKGRIMGEKSPEVQRLTNILFKNYVHWYRICTV
jgi:hypothetical protein